MKGWKRNMPNSIEISSLNYLSKDLMLKDVCRLLDILCKNGEKCSVSRFDLDDDTFYNIEHDSSDEEFASSYLYWLNADEASYIDELREDKINSNK